MMPTHASAKSLTLALLCTLSALWVGCWGNGDLPPDQLVVLVPETDQSRNWIPRYVESPLGFEMTHNLYDGLYNPKVPQLYEESLVQSVEGVRDEGDERRELTLKIRRGRYWLESKDDSEGPEVTAQTVADAWRYIQETEGFPGRARYAGSIESVTALNDETLRVTFRSPISLALTAPEVLSFRIFPVPAQRESIPLGSGAFVVGTGSSRGGGSYTLLEPARFFPRIDGGERPDVKIISKLSAADRLEEVGEGKAHVALAIPPYYQSRIRNAQHRETAPYNVWALAFSSRLSQAQRRELAASLDAATLLEAFLQEGTYGSSSIWDSQGGKAALLSPTVFPANYEVFRCMGVQLERESIQGELGTLAQRLLNEPVGFAKPMTNPAVLPQRLKVVFPDSGSFSEGVKSMADRLEELIEETFSGKQVRLEGQDPGTYDNTIKALAQGTTDAHIAIVRLDYQRRCDASRHFKNDPDPGLHGGLFSWLSDEPGGAELSWNSSLLETLRNQQACDALVVPSLQVVQAVHDLAPAKFLFRMPSLIVFGNSVDLGVHDEFALAGMRNWIVLTQELRQGEE